MKRVVLALAMSSLASSAWAANCTHSSPLFEYRSTAPLKALEADSSFIVTVFSDGCVATRTPKYDRFAGEKSWQMGSAEFIRFQRLIDRSGVRQIDAQALRHSLSDSRSKVEATTLFTVADDDIIEFTFFNGEKSTNDYLRWTSLSADLLNFPDHPEVRAIGTAKNLFAELFEPAQRGGAQQ